MQTQFAPTAAQIWSASDRMTQFVLEHLAHRDPAIWNAKPPGGVRSIAAVVTHLHNVRVKWVRLTAPHLLLSNPPPARLNRARCTIQQAQAALAESAACCAEMLAEALGESGARIQYFQRDGWAQPWPIAGAGGLRMLTYMLTHEAHHRGQICMIAHQLGAPLSPAATSRLWNWERMDKEG